MSEVDDILHLVERITVELDGKITRLGAAILAARHLDICRDTRQFARLFGVSHALVIRDCTFLDEDGVLTVEARKESSQSMRYDLSPLIQARINQLEIEGVAPQ